MCGIVGYIGTKNASDVLTDALRHLEYRGYDSAGVAIYSGEKIVITKTEGRLDDLENKIKAVGKTEGTCGIGHTRWATHGEPSDENSHPHACGKITLVHNGIIENYIELKEALKGEGNEFLSETDTEVVAVLLNKLYKDDPIKAIDELIAKLKGSYALAILFSDIPEKIYAIRHDSPLIIGVGENENFVASDIPAVLKHTRKCLLMQENEIAVVTREAVTVLDRKGGQLKKDTFEVTWDIEAAEKGGFEHFMLKEIYEEPKALKSTIMPHIEDNIPDIKIDALNDQRLKEINKIHIVACGTAMHAGLIGKSAREELARVSTEVSIASEFRYNNPIISKNDLVVIISQSGETADSLAALRLAKQKGAYTLAVVNVVGSSIAREADGVWLTSAGPEIAVASTKAYSVQDAIMYLFAIRLAYARGKITRQEAESKTKELMDMPKIVEAVIDKLNPICRELAEQNLETTDLFFIGRGMDYSLCVEGSLKLKEISYIHSEAYAAGELKHGTISLVTDSVPVIAVATQRPLFEKMIANIREVKSLGARVTLLCREDAVLEDGVFDNLVTFPNVSDLFMPLVLAVFIQLFAYHTSVVRGCDVDKPRNLAKSVTVE